MAKQMILLGDIARDVITGFEGVVVADSEYIYNCKRLSLQPQKLGPNGQPVETNSFDIDSLELVKKGKNRLESDKSGWPVALGDVVKDEVTTFTGMITSLTQWLHSGEYAGVASQELNESKPIEPRAIEIKALKVIKRRNEPVKAKDTGGPMPEPSRRK